MVPPSALSSNVTDEEAAESERLRAIWNEQRRLEATFVNNIGVAVVVTGAITPLLASLYGFSDAPLSWLTNAWLVPMFFLAGVGLNAFAVRWLKGLE